MIVIPLAGNGVTAQEAPKQEQVTGAEMTSNNNNNNIVAWAKDTGKRLRLSTYDMAGEEGWRPLVYADNYAGAMNKAKNEEQTTGRSMSKHMLEKDAVQAGIDTGDPLHLKAIKTLAKRRLLYGDQ